MTGAVGNLVFLAVMASFCAVGLLLYVRSLKSSDSLRRRLGRLASGEGDALMNMADGSQSDSNVAKVLAESGLGWSMGMFVSRVAMAVAVGFLLGVMIGSGFLAFMFSLVGVLAMWIVVRSARARRLAQCDEQMPQALEIMALALRAGHALPKALELAATETPAPLCYELRRAGDEHALGRPMPEVLVAFGERLPGCEAVNTFVVAVLVLQETGGNLIAVLDRIVDASRTRASYRARLRALTAEGRQSAKLLACLPGAFAVLAMMSDPTYADMLLHDPGGRVITLLAGGLWLCGILWTRRLVKPLS